MSLSVDTEEISVFGQNTDFDVDLISIFGQRLGGVDPLYIPNLSDRAVNLVIEEFRTQYGEG